MRKIVDYIIISYEYEDLLTQKIMSYIAEGYELYGFPYASIKSEEHKLIVTHHQSMVKYEDVNEKDC